MTLEYIAANAPSLTYARINAAIAKINDLVAARTQDLTDRGRDQALLVDAINQRALAREVLPAIAELYAHDQDTSEATQALQRRAELVDDQLAEVLTDIATVRLLVLLFGALQGTHPGACPANFTSSALGLVSETQGLDPAGCLATPFGLVYRVLGQWLIAPRSPIAIDLDAISILKVRYWRIADVLDPNNNAIDIGIQWLDVAGKGLGLTLIKREDDLRRQDGPQTLTARVMSEDGVVPRIAPPKGAVSWRPYLQTYGADGATAVESLGTADATFAGVYAPDVSSLAARLGTIEGQIAAGLPFSTPIRPSFAVADLPKPGSPGREAWARDGRARNPDGTLEAANAGTGVSVEDNGSKWVIPGTNQQVQA